MLTEHRFFLTNQNEINII